jgi:hypothetical protein
MEPHLYRFEIVRGLANAVFEARDEGSRTLVKIYQWTPEIGQRDAARAKLASLRAIANFEVFSTGASLYMVASSSEGAAEALSFLRSHDLFTGTWLNEPPPLPSLPPVVPPPLPSPFANRNAPPLPPPLPLKTRAASTDPRGPVPRVRWASSDGLTWEPIHEPAEPNFGDTLRDYNHARSMHAPEGESWFYGVYDTRHFSCLNLEVLGRNPSAQLVCEWSRRGVFLGIPYGDEILGFPSFSFEYSSRRDLEGVFIYPGNQVLQLKLKRPAILAPKGDTLTLLAPGEFANA